MTNTVKIIIGISVLGIVGYIVYKKLKKPTDPSDPTDPTDPSNPSDPSDLTQGAPKIPSKLAWVNSRGLASYLAGILNPSEQQKLTNIVAKINTDRSSNSSLYPNSSGLTGQSSDIGHALYSMKRWGNDILSEIKKY
tara:strand:- start:944 stop:1354 length:411 start_codon:yes stop_codon:yes gene_type:complete